MILVIDNYDSFAHNLGRYMELAGWKIAVARNDKISIQGIETMNPEAIVISPGPRMPQDSGICIEAIKRFGPATPILGVCLGHQCIGEAFGGTTVRAAKPMHGKASQVIHQDDLLFADIPNPFRAGRYHSLAIRLNAESPLEVIAKTADGEIMAVKHRTCPTYGVQFHPESVLTEHGSQIIANFTAIALAWRSREAAA